MSRRRAARALLMFCFVAGAGAARAEGWLVLPFANKSGEMSLDWLGEGFAISLEEQLRANGQITISYDGARDILSDWNIPSGKGVSLASALKAADHAGADRVVSGSFRLHEGELRVEAQVLDPTVPSSMGAVKENARLGYLLDLHRRLGRALLHVGQQGMTSLGAVRDSSEAPPLAAYEQYVRALIERQPGRRLEALRKAAFSFPNYPALEYRLAEALHDAGKEDEALAALEKVKTIRFTLSPEAHLLRADILLERGDAAGAVAAADAALELRDSARTRLLHAEASLATGALEEAKADLERARRMGAPVQDLDALSLRLEKAQQAPASTPQP